MTNSRHQSTPSADPTGGSTGLPPRRALVTGANKGIGRETVRRLARLGWTVWLGSRDRERGQAAVDELKADASATAPGDILLVELDVTSDDSVRAAADTVGAVGGLDVLINNAGLGGAWVKPAETTPAHFLPVYGVNLLGPVRMIHTFLPLLLAGDRPRIVNVSSGMGSFTVTTDPDRFESTMHSLVYPSSKAALNMVTSQLAKSLAGEVTVLAVDPGYTATDLNNNRGFQTVEVGAAPVVAAATGEGVDAAIDGPPTLFGQDGFIGW